MNQNLIKSAKDAGKRGTNSEIARLFVFVAENLSNVMLKREETANFTVPVGKMDSGGRAVIKAVKIAPLKMILANGILENAKINAKI